MKVILNVDIANLGEEGDVLNVAPGYARNYLLPKGLVSMYNKSSLAALESRRAQIEKRKAEKRQNALSVKDKIGGTTLELKMPAGDNGKLFGAVTSQMIVDELAALGIEVERKKVEIPGHTLKALGNYKLKIRLYGEEVAELSVNVVREGAAPEVAPTAPAAPVAEAAAEEAPAETAEESADSDEE